MDIDRYYIEEEEEDWITYYIRDSNLRNIFVNTLGRYIMFKNDLFAVPIAQREI